MKINEVTIEKFRSIKKAILHMNDITAVVGENNAGKTAVLRAINAVLNFKYEEDGFLKKTHQYAPRTNSHITIVFGDVPKREIYEGKTVDRRLTLKFTYSYSDSRRRYSIIIGRENITADEMFLKELAKDIRYVYIPAGRTNKDVKWQQNSIFQELITSYAAKHTENRDRISGYVRKATEKIHDSIFIKLEKDINGLYMQNHDMDFRIGFPENLDYTVLLENTEISLNGEGYNYLLKEWGSGTKSLAIIAMHRANALLNSGSIVLGIEEPEINLHPQAQKRFIMSLRNQMHKNETQAIFTTHSTVLVDELDHDDIILVRRVKDESRGFYSNISQLGIDFWSRNNIEEFKHYQYFRYRNSEFFFSEFVVVAESKNDCQVFEKLVTPSIGEKAADISYLNAEGVESIKYPYFLLKELQIPFVIVVDRDFFFPYAVDNKLEESRNTSTGLPAYAGELKSTEVIKQLITTQSDRDKIANAHKKGYRVFFEEIKKHHILSMNYCLEMDLTCSSKARDEYYKMLNILPVNQNQKFLLISNKKSIKDIGKIIKILDAIPKRTYPESFIKIRNAIIEEINTYM